MQKTLSNGQLFLQSIFENNESFVYVDKIFPLFYYCFYVSVSSFLMKLQRCPFLLKYAAIHTTVAVRSFVFLPYLTNDFVSNVRGVHSDYCFKSLIKSSDLGEEECILLVMSYLSI